MTSETPTARGRRLAAEGRVKHDEGAQVYLIQSDSGHTYTVIVDGGGWPRCDCQATTTCAHIYAVQSSRVREALC